MPKVSSFLYSIRSIIRSFIVLYVSAFVMFKLLFALFAEQIPHAGPSFRHFGIMDWCLWLVAIEDILVVSIYAGFYFLIGVYWLKKYHSIQISIWGAFVSAYNFLLVPLTYLDKLQNALDNYWPPANNPFLDYSLIISILIIIFVLVPLVMLWLIGLIARYPKNMYPFRRMFTFLGRLPRRVIYLLNQMDLR